MKFLIMPKPWRRCIARPKGKLIRDPVFRVISMGVGVAHSFEVDIYRLGTLYVCLISIRVSLVELFMSHSGLLMGVNQL